MILCHIDLQLENLENYYEWTTIWVYRNYFDLYQKDKMLILASSYSWMMSGAWEICPGYELLG